MTKHTLEDREIEDLYRSFVFGACIDIIAHSHPGVPQEADEEFLNANLHVSDAEMRNIVQKAKKDPRILEMLQNGYQKELKNRLKAHGMV